MTSTAKRTLHGPGNLRLVLDRAEVIPNDPGAGTPAMVYAGRHSGTYGCALDTGELACGEYQLSPKQHAWLDAQEDLVWSFLQGAEV